MKTRDMKAPSAAPVRNSGFFRTGAGLEDGRGRFFGPVPAIQPKLAMGAPGDRFEQEADAAADRVVQRMEAGGIGQAGPPALQAQCADCREEETLQREAKAGTAGTAVPHTVQRALGNKPGGGEPLQPALRGDMENAFTVDFSGVRIHTGPTSTHLNRSLNARAFTYGRDVYFDSGEFSPQTRHGRHLLAHELTHVIQQRGSGGLVGHTNGDRVQRQNAPVQTDEPVDLGAVFADYERAHGKPPPEWVKNWARRYEPARRQVPDAPPLDKDGLDRAIEFRRTWQREPPIPERPQPRKLAPGAVGANEILAFPKGTTVVVTQLLAEVLTRFRDTVLDFAKGASDRPTDLAANAPLLIDILTSPDISRSLRATVKESSPTLFEAQIAIPDIPAKDKRPAVTARTITFHLEASDDAEPTFDLRIDWGSGRARVLGIKARRSGNGKIVVTAPVQGYEVDMGLTRDSSGSVVAEIDHAWIRMALSGQTLKLVRMDPMALTIDPAQATADQTRLEKAAQTSGTIAPRPYGISFDTGYRYAGQSSALYSLGWRFTYALAGDFVGLPLMVQLDYAPKAGLVSGNVGFGVSITPFSLGDVPVTFSVIPGLRGGAVDVGGAGGGASPILGPSLGLGAGLSVTPRFQVQLSGEYFHNVLNSAAEKGVDHVPSVQLGSVLRF